MKSCRLTRFLPFFLQPAEKGKKAKKEKKIKDPNAPKRPPSAYLEFQNSVRAKFRDEEPNLSYQDVLRKISAVWSGMPDDEKKVSQLSIHPTGFRARCACCLQTRSNASAPDDLALTSSLPFPSSGKISRPKSPRRTRRTRRRTRPSTPQRPATRR